MEMPDEKAILRTALRLDRGQPAERRKFSEVDIRTISYLLDMTTDPSGEDDGLILVEAPTPERGQELVRMSTEIVHEHGVADHLDPEQLAQNTSEPERDGAETALEIAINALEELKLFEQGRRQSHARREETIELLERRTERMQELLGRHRANPILFSGDDDQDDIKEILNAVMTALAWCSYHTIPHYFSLERTRMLISMFKIFRQIPEWYFDEGDQGYVAVSGYSADCEWIAQAYSAARGERRRPRLDPAS
jgi:hypothetical protein